jgi:heparosan-N-sulfate-glucuronate 5-epimerase
MPAYFRNWKPDNSALKDANGVVIKKYPAPLGRQYTPTEIAQAALEYYDRWLVDKDPKLAASDKAAFLAQINWLLANQLNDGRWLFTFKWGHMKPPWWSAMTEGVAMSALLRAYSITGDPNCLTAITKARTTFERDLVSGNGVGMPVPVGSKTYVVYQEYPRGYGEPNVLNGWIFSMVGLYETATYLHDQVAMADLTGPDRGFAALKAMLPYYDAGNWSRYYITTPGTVQHGAIDTMVYHKLVIGQLKYLTQITGDPFFATWAAKFQGYLDVCTKAAACPPARH